jgi:glycosyltransferase involved in cell wall biosynthesis
MKITIVTLSFNQGNFLESAINSILSQDHNLLEYIVVDPGSCDDSRKIIRRYDSKISRLILQPDMGPADGLANAFKFATGDIFGFLNADDVLADGALSKISKFFKSHSDVDVLSGNSLIVDSCGIPYRKVISDRFILSAAEVGESILIQPSTFFKASLFSRSGGFNVHNKCDWDAELFLNMGLHGAIFSRIPVVLSSYRIHEGSITGSGALKSQIETSTWDRYRRLHPARSYRFYRLQKLIFKWVRKFLNYRDTFERLIHGPVIRR